MFSMYPKIKKKLYTHGNLYPTRELRTLKYSLKIVNELKKLGQEKPAQFVKKNENLL